MPSRTRFTSVDQYIKSCHRHTQPVLKRLRSLISQALPPAEQVVSYNIGCFKLNSKYIVYFAGYENHVGIYPIPKDTTGIKNLVEKYKSGKGTLRFSLNKPLPTGFIKKVVKQLAKERLAK